MFYMLNQNHTHNLRVTTCNFLDSPEFQTADFGEFFC